MYKEKAKFKKDFFRESSREFQKGVRWIIAILAWILIISANLIYYTLKEYNNNRLSWNQ